MFNTREASTEEANGVDLYQFKCGPNSWEYTNAEEPQEYKGKTYEPLVISNNGVRQSGDASNNETLIILPKDIPVSRMLVEDIPSIPVQVIIRRRHWNSPDAPIFVIAELYSFNRAPASMLELNFQMMTASFSRSGARMSWSRQCQHALYDRNCKVNANAFDVNVEIQKIENAKILSADVKPFKDRYFDNGFIEWVNTYGITQRRTIEKHRGNELVILGRIDMLSPGDDVKAYPGCPRTTQACDEKFDNLPNYGGINFLPGKSPFQGDPTW